MLRPEQLLCPKPEGLYCPPGDFFIDPVRPVPRAVITHGHADHARAGHGAVLATPPTIEIMRVRYGEDFAPTVQALDYGQRVMRDDVEVSFAPAGHVLGSAQAVVRWKGLTMVVYAHGAMARLNTLYEAHGIDLGPIEPATGGTKKDFEGKIIIAPPSAVADRWSRRFPDPVDAFCSGWMRVRARARQRAVELPLIISDHCDWGELTRTLEELRPGEVWITHGREEALQRWCELNGLPARALALVGYEDEEE